jgi:hypothetical protein
VFVVVIVVYFVIDSSWKLLDTPLYSIVVGKLLRKRLLGTQNHRWIHNIKINLREMKLYYVNWNGLEWVGSG